MTAERDPRARGLARLAFAYGISMPELRRTSLSDLGAMVDHLDEVERRRDRRPTT